MHWETVRRRGSGAVVQLDFIDEGLVHEAVLVDDVIRRLEIECKKD